MRMEIKYTTKFRSNYKKANKEIKEAFSETLILFLENPNHPSLRNHPLNKEYIGYRSINITADWRAIFKEKKSEKQITVTFHMLGTHKKLYG